MAKSLLFHGTSLRQLEKMRAGGYVADGLYVGDSVENIAWHYAEEASKRDGSDPVIIHLDERKLRRLGELVPDVHSFGGGEEEEQIGQWIYSGPLRDAIVKLEGWGEDGEYDIVLEKNMATKKKAAKKRGSKRGAYIATPTGMDPHGRRAREWTVDGLSDKECRETLRRIFNAMDVEEWNADTLDEIYLAFDAVRLSPGQVSYE